MNTLTRGILAPLFVIALFTSASSVEAFVMPPECANLSMAAHDTDEDGLDDRFETCIVFTDMTKADTDVDGMNDFIELISGLSPRHEGAIRLVDVDSDEDYLNDDWELKLGTGLLNPDTDHDGFLDGTEVAASFDPLDPSPAASRQKLLHVKDKELRLVYSFGDIELGTLPVSTGKSWTPTPHGEFEVLRKINEKAYIGTDYNFPGVKFNLWFAGVGAGRYYIHSAYWHNNFGRLPVSGGCVNVRIEDMVHLYWFAEQGTDILID